MSTGTESMCLACGAQLSSPDTDTENVDINEEFGVEDPDSDGNTPLHRAVQSGSQAGTLALLKRNLPVDPVNNYNQNTPLIDASVEGHEGIVLILLHHGADTESRNAHGNTPLLVAAFNGHEKVVSILLSHKAEVDSRNNSQNTPLQLAAFAGYDKIVSRLLESGAEIDSCNNEKNTSLQLAASAGHDRAAFVLLSHKAEVDSCNDTGNTSLQLACTEGHEEVARILLQHGAGVDSFNYDGYTPLHFAAENGKARIVALLLSKHAGHSRMDEIRRVPLHLACNKGFRDIAEMLLKAGADVNVETDGKWTPLHFACAKDKDQKDGEMIDVIKFLIANGARVNQATDTGITPLHFACTSVHPSAIEYLVRKGANIHQQNDEGESPFQLALEAPSIREYEPLLYEKAGLLRTNEEGWSVLHKACFENTLEKVEALLSDVRLDPSIPNAAGKSALGLAVDQGYQSLALCLLGSEQYYPASPVKRCGCLTSRTELSDIETKLSQYYRDSTLSDTQLGSIAYWMIANKSERFFENLPQPGLHKSPHYKGGMHALHIAAQYGNLNLIQGNLSDLNPDDTSEDGSTALHASAAFGHREITEILLHRNPISHNGQVALKLIVDRILQPDNQGESPFSLAVKEKHYLLRNYFWDELRRYTMNKDFQQADPDRAEKILELASRFERPGEETYLLAFLKKWFGEPSPEICNKINLQPKDWNVLHHVVHRGEVVALWWLLSNGGHFENQEINFAHLILEARQSGETTTLMSELLQSPPKIIEQATITDNDDLTRRPPMHSGSSLNNYQVTIVDFYTKNDQVDFQVIQRPLDHIIYDQNLGPNKLMEDALSKDYRHLDSLKQKLRTRDFTAEANSRSTKAAKKADLGTLEFRWLHLPINHVRIQ
ncbi:Mg2+ transporter protein CorA-like/Zinc transport protein ZntB [Penicillium vulpinum]|uniref:Mg2+ transporter protein CorA-like/Zinc transport protein ZntB n=1 Tax=Penicillium vulpinum TaxID=29845 RepID=UPI002547D443|nr:Mg2+ transporter protein CorA-like/Zinc transport protein ZntB [Penicillium vulpinum]KAJ5970460.1 Mg2+ transporter protein CorA-like/Zinc transport protein ZntB [Penicillium vulpinum]